MGHYALNDLSLLMACITVNDTGFCGLDSQMNWQEGLNDRCFVIFFDVEETEQTIVVLAADKDMAQSRFSEVVPGYEIKRVEETVLIGRD